jgi:hypothetical protein
MRRTLSLLVALILLQACQASSKVRDPGPPVERAGSPAAPGASTAGALSDTTLERSYRSPVPLCLDAAVRVCGECECQVRSQDRTGDQAASLRAEGRSIKFSLAFARTPANRTRAVLQLQGQALQENRDEAARLLDRICQALLEPRE